MNFFLKKQEKTGKRTRRKGNREVNLLIPLIAGSTPPMQLLLKNCC
ncbi:hypothetical protein FDUTEX481_02967 [Tolypothrix sp. PCC 7601]|nr:hypothetical protein FDUTEX481_02967 [Tolypothrix sp. PCC 7601]